MEQNELNLYAKTLRKNMTEEEKIAVIKWYDYCRNSSQKSCC